MARLFNLALMTTATTGTGPITLGSAVSGYLTFAQAGVTDGNVVSYGIRDGSNSEVGTGTYTAAGTTLTRTVIKSTNSDAAINLSGSAQVYVTALAEDVVHLDVANTWSATQTFSIPAGTATRSINGSIDLGTATVTEQFYANAITILDNMVDNGHVAEGFLVNYSWGGTNVSVGRIAFGAQSALVTSSTLGVGEGSLGGAFIGSSTVNAGGTNTGAGARGAVAGANLIGQLSVAATNFNSVTGAEINADTRSGATVKYRWGVAPIALGDGPAGVAGDAAVVVWGSATSPWKNLLYLVDLNPGAPPIATTGAILATDGTAYTIAKVIDLTNVTITGNIFTFTNYTLSGSTANVASTLIASGTAEYKLAVAGNVIGSYFADSGQLLFGTTVNLPLKFITNNVAKTQLSGSVFSPAVDAGTALGSASLQWSGLFLAGTQTVNPPAGTAQGFLINQNISGSPTGVAAWNRININSDNADVSGADTDTGFGLYLEHTVGGSSTKGSRATVFAHQIVTADATTSAANRDFIGLASLVDSNVAMPVTATPASLFAFSGTVGAGVSSTGLNALVGAEIDLQPSVAIPYILGWNIVYGGSQAASTRSIGYQLAATQTGWKYGFALTNQHGANALTSTGTVMALLEAQTVDTVFDFHLATVSNYIFNFSNFLLTGSTTVPVAAIDGSTSGEYNIKVSGSPTAAFYASSSQTLIGSIAATPVKIIYNNTNYATFAANPVLEIKGTTSAVSEFYYPSLPPSVVRIYEGSSGSPVTTGQPVVGISKHQAVTVDTVGAQDAALSVNNANYSDSPIYNVGYQADGALISGIQYGKGSDAVGVWAEAEHRGAGLAKEHPVSSVWLGSLYTYEIAFVGTTDFTTVGAANNNIGTIFTATGTPTGTGRVKLLSAATSLVVGGTYEIKTVGTTDFTLVGAPNNNIGTQFVANGTATGTGTGTTYYVYAGTAWASFLSAYIPAGSIAGLVAGETNVANNSGFNHTWEGSISGYTFPFVGFLSAAFDAVSNGTNRVSAAYMVRRGSSYFDVGFSAAPEAIISSFARDDSASESILKATNTHTYGINFQGATVTNPWVGPSSTSLIDGSGNATFVSGAFSGIITDTRALPANTSGDGLVLQNTTAATSANQRYSPALHFIGQGWKTDTPAVSEQVEWKLEVIPVQNTAHPTPFLNFASNIAGGGFNNRIQFDDDGSTLEAKFLGTNASALNLAIGGSTGATFYLDATQVIFGSVANIPLKFYTNNTERIRVPSPGGLVIGTAALATNATDGFLYIPSCAGAPSGTPTAYTGCIPLVYDSTNNFLYVYNGGWKKSTVYA